MMVMSRVGETARRPGIKWSRLFLSRRKSRNAKSKCFRSSAAIAALGEPTATTSHPIPSRHTVSVERMFFSSSMTSACRMGRFSVAVIGGSSLIVRRADRACRPSIWAALREEIVRRATSIAYVEAAGVVALSAGLSCAVFGRSQLADVVMLFLLGIVIVSLRLGHGPSLFAAVLAVLVYDFFFIPPFYSFAVTDLRHVVTFAVMLLVAVVISSLTRRVRDHAEDARQREHRTAVLYDLSRDLAPPQSVHDIVVAGARHIARGFGSRMAVFG